MGLKEYVPPYLDPTLSLEELMTGVSFASGGSGFDPLTPRISVSVSLFFLSHTHPQMYNIFYLVMCTYTQFFWRSNLANLIKKLGIPPLK